MAGVATPDMMYTYVFDRTKEYEYKKAVLKSYDTWIYTYTSIYLYSLCNLSTIYTQAHEIQ